MNIVKSLLLKLNFTNGQRNGVLVLLVLILVLQLFYWNIDAIVGRSVSREDKDWLSLQAEIDEMKGKVNEYKMMPFNPNFISDYKGYKLGMSIQEIDKLHAFRKANRYVNSVSEFQQVTGVSDELLQKIAPFFKFPEWVNNKKEHASFLSKKWDNATRKVVSKGDINLATLEEIKKIYGIGDALAARIFKHKEQLGGFVAMEQLNDIWGLSPEVIENIKTHFEVKVQPQVKLIDINNASLKELSQFYYFRYALARQIVIYRSMNGDIKNSDDLIKIKDFPVEKAKIIALYLKY